MLVHPTTLEGRYVGKSSSGLKRPKQHISDNRMLTDTNPHKKSWLAKLKREGQKPEVLILEEFDSQIGLPEAEAWWIGFFRLAGFRLLNSSKGWQPPLTDPVQPPKVKLRISPLKGRKLPKEVREKISKALTGRKLSPEHRAKLFLRPRFTPERKKRTSEKSKGLVFGPPSQEKRRKIASSLGCKPFTDEHGNVFYTQREAAQFHGIDNRSVSQCLRGQVTKTHGHVFKYVESIAC